VNATLGKPRLLFHTSSMNLFPSDAGSVVLLLLSSVVTFFIARRLGNRWRADRRKRQEQAARAAETRQVRRARQRKQG
jgi:uncharacterized membrane protein YdjX (TVP38/TMEM64 family)